MGIAFVAAGEVQLRGVDEEGDLSGDGPGGHLPGDEPSRGPRRPRRGRRGGDGNDPFDFGGQKWLRWALIAFVIVTIAMVSATLFGATEPEEIDYSEFVELVEEGDVAQITIDEEGRVRGELEDETEFTTVVPTALPLDDLEQQLHDEGVAVEAEPPATDWWSAIIWILPLILIVGFFVWMMRRAQGQMGQIRGMTQSQAQVIDRERPDTRFDDVAGYEDVKQEIQEIIDYLKEPERYAKAGARGPGGVLLLGPPGTGKTLLARAVAGEADVPFISAAGSEFVEMLVGVGASRVRDLFEKARERTPSIIFIDELDSVGRKRGGSQTIGANNEQEQTLNQLLSEMDGFDPSEGIVVIAATNRSEMLDEALLRPGRFDRQISVPLPTLEDRRKILKVHVAGKPVADELDLDVVARATPGFSGADLENLVNEAAINAVREEHEEIIQEDFDAARDRIMLGHRKESDILRPEERTRVAVHEAGHAFVGAMTDESDPVSKVTILPARQALGTTESLPLDERRLYPEGYLLDTLAARLGGRVAELIVLDEPSSGAAHDLVGATQMATKMVREFGFSDIVGPVGYHSGDDNGAPNLLNRPYADDTQRAVDEEVKRILREAEDRARRIIEDNRETFDELVERLLDKEVLDGEEIYEIVGKPVPRREDQEQGETGTAGVAGP